MALLPGSPAIGAGSLSYIPGSKTPITNDQRGHPLDKPIPDIGAFQTSSGWSTGAATLIVNTTTDDPGSALGDLSLRQAVNLANVLGKAALITFDATAFSLPQTITLTSGQLELSDSGGLQQILGSPVGVTINGGGGNRVFQIDGDVQASFSGLTITGGGGTALAGGGLLNLGTITLSGCTLTGNRSTSAGGGLANYGDATLSGCTLSNNSSAEGGGLANFGSATLSKCTISGNSATTGGGVSAATRSGNGGEYLSLAISTISGNSASQSGGGVANLNSGMMLTACTVSGDLAPSGGGLSNSNFAKLTSTIVAGNRNPAGIASDIGGSGITSGGFNLIGPGGAGGLKNKRQGNIILRNLNRLLLAPLGKYGGPTQTMAVLPGSAAIGNGAAVKGAATDQRGFARPLGHDDIGAVEDQGYTIRIVPGATSQRTRTNGLFPRPLVVRVFGRPGDPVTGGVVSFSAPSKRSSASLTPSNATIGPGGYAQIQARANSVPGAYAVTAWAAGVSRPAVFSLRNLRAAAASALRRRHKTH